MMLLSVNSMRDRPHLTPLPAPRKIIGYHTLCNVELAVDSVNVRRGGSLVAGPEEAA
jgi:hypothetical protein